LRPREDVEPCGSTCSTEASTGLSATTPAARTKRKFESRRRHLRREVRVRRRRVSVAGSVHEGRKRGLTNKRIAQLTSWNPAQRFGLSPKEHRVGLRRRLLPGRSQHSWTVHAEESASARNTRPLKASRLVPCNRHLGSRMQVLDHATSSERPAGSTYTRQDWLTTPVCACIPDQPSTNDPPWAASHPWEQKHAEQRRGRPTHGLRVIDLATILAGPLTARFSATMAPMSSRSSIPPR